MTVARGMNLIISEGPNGVMGTMMVMAIDDNNKANDVEQFQISEAPTESIELREAWIVEMLALAAEQSSSPLPECWVDVSSEQRRFTIQRAKEAVEATDKWISDNDDPTGIAEVLGRLLGSVKPLLKIVDQPAS